MRQIARVDLHGAGRGAETVRSTCGVPIVLVELSQSGYAFGIGATILKVADLALDNYPHP